MIPVFVLEDVAEDASLRALFPVGAMTRDGSKERVSLSLFERVERASLIDGVVATVWESSYQNWTGADLATDRPTGSLLSSGSLVDNSANGPSEINTDESKLSHKMPYESMHGSGCAICIQFAD